MTSTRPEDIGPDPVDDYLDRLDVALRDVPFGTAREIRAGIAEELDSLDPIDARARIAELGDPATIAAEASEAGGVAPAAPTWSAAPAPAPAPASGFGRSPGFVVTTAIAIAVGGIVVPFAGWLVGVVLLWSGRVWTRLEQAIATFAPALATIVGVAIAWLVESTQQPAASGGVSPLLPTMWVASWWLVVLGLAIGNIAVGLWLLVVGMRRTRG